MSKYARNSYTARDKELAAQLAAPEVDEEWARQYVAQAAAEIRAGWTEQNRAKKAGEVEPPVELREFHRHIYRNTTTYKPVG